MNGRCVNCANAVWPLTDIVHPTPPKFRTLLILGRVSNVPTVWSNCLAGWALGGGGDWQKFFWLCLGATWLYVGGMFLNDAFDAGYDRQYRRQRPIPSGAIAAKEVWAFGFFFLLLGVGILFFLGRTTAILTIWLAAFILIYDAIHKVISPSPLVMACCRLLLYLVAASTAARGVSGLAIWSALALAAYIVGLSYLARKETARGALQSWPCYFLAAPIFLALLVNDGGGKQIALSVALLVGLWILWSLRQTFWSAQRNVGITVSLLLAGIPLIDWLAVSGGNFGMSVTFVALFLAALLFQRFIPAT